MTYLWRNTTTGEVIEHDHYSTPPTQSAVWKRVFSFGVGRIEGGGSTPARPSTKYDRTQ